LDFDERPELRTIVLHNEFVVFNLKEGVRARNADVCDFHVGFDAPTDFEVTVPQVKHVHHLSGH
jgi:hypothetical protein